MDKACCKCDRWGYLGAQPFSGKEVGECSYVSGLHDAWDGANCDGFIPYSDDIGYEPDDQEDDGEIEA